MKKLIILFVVPLLVLTSCDIMERFPESSLDASIALTDGNSARSIMQGAYSSMQAGSYYGVEYVLNNDLAADNAIFQGFFDSQDEINQRKTPYTNLWVTTAWVNIYRVVNISNLLITGIPNIEDELFSTAARNRLLGEAHAVRALAYFDLLRVYGYHFDTGSNNGLPLLTDIIPNNDFQQIPDLQRSTVGATYALILSDLDIAIANLSGFNDKGRMNYWAALALRARVNLYAKNYGAAFQDANTVIENGPFQLLENLTNLYSALETTSESIFEVEFNDQDQSGFNTFTVRRDEYNVDPSLPASFEAGDARAAFIGRLRNRDRTLKYLNGNNSNNAKVIRLAEMHLIRSEAAVFRDNDPNAGSTDLNIIRDRAKLGPVAVFTSINEYVDALLQERRAEFNYEGHRFFDLVRHDRINSILGMEDFRKAFPIPRNELLISNNLNQNPNYTTP
jgi:hypothetical protein